MARRSQFFGNGRSLEARNDAAAPTLLPAGSEVFFETLHEPLANFPLFLEEAETIGPQWGIITLR